MPNNTDRTRGCEQFIAGRYTAVSDGKSNLMIVNPTPHDCATALAYSRYLLQESRKVFHYTAEDSRNGGDRRQHVDSRWLLQWWL